jgi:hypothetical protein
MAGCQSKSLARNAVIAAALLLSSCATGADVGAMTAAPPSMSSVAPSSPLYHAVHMGTVSGGQDTNPLWMSEVSNQNFSDALKQSLAQQSILADSGAPRFTVNAQLLSLDQPYIAFNTTVTAKVRYTVTRDTDHSTGLNDVVTTPYTARVVDQPIGFMRLKLANEGAMKANISAFIAKLTEAAGPGQPLGQ